MVFSGKVWTSFMHISAVFTSCRLRGWWLKSNFVALMLCRSDFEFTMISGELLSFDGTSLTSLSFTGDLVCSAFSNSDLLTESKQTTLLYSLVSVCNMQLKYLALVLDTFKGVKSWTNPDSSLSSSNLRFAMMDCLAGKVGGKVHSYSFGFFVSSKQKEYWHEINWHWLRIRACVYV